MNTHNIPYQYKKSSEIILNSISLQLWDFFVIDSRKSLKQPWYEPPVFKPLKFYCYRKVHDNLPHLEITALAFTVHF